MRLSPIRLCYALRRIPRNTRAAQSSSLHEAYSGSSNRKSVLPFSSSRLQWTQVQGVNAFFGPRGQHIRQIEGAYLTPDTKLWEAETGSIAMRLVRITVLQISYAHDDADKGHSSILQYENSPSPLTVLHHEPPVPKPKLSFRSSSDPLPLSDTLQQSGQVTQPLPITRDNSGHSSRQAYSSYPAEGSLQPQPSGRRYGSHSPYAGPVPIPEHKAVPLVTHKHTSPPLWRHRICP
ncbi:hypothetical protein BJV77DRAFT_85956 [Russula vinacea]|nr:hypothetical protein BJV77DRAFT_85956 [Russula vinacea]